MTKQQTSSAPYRTPADIAADIPPDPRPKPWKWPSWTSIVVRLFVTAASIMVIGLISDVWGGSSYHGLLGAAGIVVGIVAFASGMSVLGEVFI